MTDHTRRAWLVALFAAALYAPTLLAKDFLHDDAYIVAGNALLRRWSSLPVLLSQGYWEGAVGAGAPVQEYRPVLMLSFFLNRALLGDSPWGYHLVNLLLHAGVCAALFWALARGLGPRPAFAAALLFAALPVHVEAVAAVSGRSELLVLLFLLMAWLRQERRLESWLWFCLALLTKEQAVLYPVFLAAADRIEGRRRAATHAGLWAAVLAVVALRLAVLGRPFHGGHDYFASTGALAKLLTVAKFWTFHYLWPMATGLGLRSDYSRPLIADSGPGDAAAWLSVMLWGGLAAATVLGAARRRGWALGGLLFFLPLLPTSHALIRLDAIGAERFLYAPSIAFCVLAGRAGRPALALLALYAPLCLARESVWLSEKAYAEAAVRGNPVSARARSSLGVVRARAGDLEGAERVFREAIALDAERPAAYYNLARLYLESGRLEEAEAELEKISAADPDADALVLRAVIAERRGRLPAAAGYLEKALAIRPWDALAHFNLGRLLYRARRPDLGAPHLRRYLELDPAAAEAAQVRALLDSDQILKSSPR